MTATKELRRLLKERGVKYEAWDEPEEEILSTQWEADGFACDADDRGERIYLSADRLITPEQAVEATLGRGECKMVLINIDGLWMCTECGYVNAGFALQPGLAVNPNYCPNCGKKVVNA